MGYCVVLYAMPEDSSRLVYLLVYKNQHRDGLRLTRHGREAMKCVSFPSWRTRAKYAGPQAPHPHAPDEDDGKRIATLFCVHRTLILGRSEQNLIGLFRRFSLIHRLLEILQSAGCLGVGGVERDRLLEKRQDSRLATITQTPLTLSHEDSRERLVE